MSPEHIGAPGMNPWPGLASYTAEMRELFFGRESESIELTNMIRRELLTILFGRSGLGKTSLLKASVLPEMEASGLLPITLRIDYAAAGLSPMEQVKSLVQQAAAAAGVDLAGIETIDPQATLWEFLHAAEFWGPRNDQLTPLLVLDQFEEVFTLGLRCTAQQEFLNQLADLAENRVPKSLMLDIEQRGERLKVSRDANYKIVLAIREDFVSKLDLLRPILPSILRNRLALTPLHAECARHVILKAGSHWVTPEVADIIVDAVSGNATAEDEIEPAYLSVMCHELFRRMQALGRDSIGGDLVEQEKGGILEALYTRSLEGFGPGIPAFIENRLLTATGFRAAVPIQEAEREGVSLSALDQLVDRRLLRYEDRLGTRQVELSHDLLTGVVLKSRNERLEQERRAAEMRRNRSLRLQLRKARLRTVVASLAATVVVGAGVFIWLAFFHVYTLYSKATCKQFGESRPTDRISLQTVHHRGCSVRFRQKGFWRGGRTLTIETIDSLEKPSYGCGLKTYLTSDDQQNEAPDFSRVEYVYDNDGMVVYETGWNKFHQMIWGLMYAPASNQSDARKVRVATFVGPDGLPQPQRNSHAEMIEFHYDEHGNEVKVFFKDREGHPTPGPWSAYGHEQAFDPHGRLVRDTSLDASGHPMNDSAGNASQIITYDPEGNQAQYAALDAAGHPTMLSDGGYSINKTKFDRWGNVTEEAYFDTSGHPVLNSTTGCYRMEMLRDSHGSIVQAWCFGVNGERLPSKEWGAHSVKMEYDSNGNQASWAVFDEKGKPTSDTDGAHLYRHTYDRNGFLESTTSWDENNQALDLDGSQKTVMVNDSFGRPVEFRYFKKDGSPAPSSDKTTYIWKKTYDPRGRVIKTENLGRRGEPVLGSPGKVYITTWAYDRFGNATDQRFYDTSSKPTLGEDGCHATQNRYNEYGQETESKCLGVHMEPVDDTDGQSSKRLDYNSDGLMVDVYFYNAAGKPVDEDGDDARRQYTYNAKRQAIQIEHFSAAGRPTGAGQIFREVNEYDDSGRQIRHTEYDAALHLIGSTTGSGNQWVNVYKNGKVVEEDFKDNQGRLHNDQNGEAIRKFKYDERGSRAEESHWDENGRPAWPRNGESPVTKNRYDAHGNLIHQEYEDGYGRLAIRPALGIASADAMYDASQRKTGAVSYGTDGRTICDLSGNARWKSEFDGNGKLLRSLYYDENGVRIFTSLPTNEPDILADLSAAYLKEKGLKRAITVVGLKPDPLNRISLAHQLRLHIGDVLLDYGGHILNLDDPKSTEVARELLSENGKTEKMLGVLRNGRRLEFKVRNRSMGADLRPVQLPTSATAK